MPFTLAHPGAVVFMKNKYLNLSGLVLGSMAPDFMYFILFSPSSNFGHTILGMVILNIPLCFFLNFIYEKYIKQAFILNLPRGLSKKYSFLIDHRNTVSHIREAFIFTYSSVVGMMTHVFWDSFTHNTGYFVAKLSYLRLSIDFWNYKIYVYKICQHGSTLLGFITILIFLSKIKNERPTQIIPLKNKIVYHSLALFIGICVVGLSYIIFKDSFGIGRIVVTSINGLLLGYLASSIRFYISCS